MKFLVAGFGSIGRRHLRNLRALGEEDILLLRSHKATIPDDEIRDLPVETTVEAALAHHPDGVIIANPTALHLDVAIPAAKQGCAILMEKPVTDDFSRIGDLQEALVSGGGRLQMGFQFRFHPGLRKVSELLSSGVVGRPLSFRAEWGEYLPGWHPWEDYRNTYAARKDLGGGVLLTLSHPLDYVRFLFGNVRSITGFNGKISDLEMDVDDLAELVLEMENGAVGSVHMDYFGRPVKNCLDVTCSEGRIHWENADASVRMWDVDGQETLFMPESPFDRNNLFLDEMRRFIDVCARRAEPSCTLEDGLAVQDLIRQIRGEN